MAKKWICRIIGHRDINPEATYDPLVCKYCGECDAYDEPLYDPRHVEAFRRLRFWLKCHYWRCKAWLTRCPECGERFGRCDPNDDKHMPF